MGSTPAQSSIVSFAKQAAKIGRGGTYNVGDYTWYKFNTLENGLGTVQDQQVFPPESGGPLTPRGAYKQQKFFGGTVTIIPRLESTLGFLLKAAMGSASTVTGHTADGAAVVGVNTHIFRFDPSDAAGQPWMTVRRHIPTPGSSNYFGEIGFDCKVGLFDLTIPAMGKLVARVQMVGRDVTYDSASNAWTYANATFDDELTSPDSGRGFFKIGGVEYPSMGASFQLMNGLTSPQQEMIIGDFAPDDFIALTRGAQIQFVYKYENADLYRTLLGGVSNATEWSSLPFVKDTAGATYAMQARFETPGEIVTGYPYALEIRANKVTVAVTGPIELQPGNIITQTFVLTVLTDKNSAIDYLQFIVENDEPAATYA